MKIKCGNCSIDHELEPPAWVVSSGRPFRFRCSSCGFSQMVQPQGGSSAAAATASAPSASPVAAPNASPVPAGAQPAPITPALPTNEVPRPPSEQGGGGTVYLKQDGKVYLIKDWSTMQRWIMERRVERTDLVSEGGVKWEPIGSRPELGSFFAAVDRMEAVERGEAAPASPSAAAAAPVAPPSPAPAPPPAPEPPPSPFGSSSPPSPFAAASAPPSPFASSAPPPSPFAGMGDNKPPGLFGGGDFFGGGGGEEGGPKGRFARLDEDTEGVPMGLPDLPTEDLGGGEEAGLPAPRRFVDASLSPEEEAKAASAKGGDDFVAGSGTPEPAPFREPARPTMASIPPGVERDGDDLIAPPALPTPAPAPMRDPPPPELRAEPSLARLGAGSEPSPAPTERVFARPRPDEGPGVAPSEPAAAGGAGGSSVSGDSLDSEMDFPAKDQHTDEAWGEPAKRRAPVMWPWVVAGAFTLVLALVAVIAIGVTLTQTPKAPPRPPGDDPSVSDILGNGKVPGTPETKVPEVPPETKAPEVPPETKAPEVPPETKAPEVPPETKAPEVPPETKAPETKAPETKQPETKTPETKAPEAKTPPPPPKPPSVSALVDKGWKLVDSGKYADAAASFEKALGQNAGHPDANLGMGYALLKQGKKDDATAYLCKAVATTGSAAAEARGMINSNDITCP